MALLIQEEEWSAVQARLGNIEFWTQSGGRTGPRRLHPFNRPYVNGADLEDTGSDPKETNLQALLTRSQVTLLEALRDAKKTVTYRDPTLGSWRARLMEIAPNWDSRRLNFYDASLTIKRDGPAGDIVIPPPAPRAAADQYKGAAADLQTRLQAVFNAPDAQVAASLSFSEAASAVGTESGLDAALVAFNDALEAELDAAPDTANGANALRRALNDLQSAAQLAADEIIALIPAYSLLAETEAGARASPDLLQELVDSALAAVEAVEYDAPQWGSIMITSTSDLATVLQQRLSKDPTTGAVVPVTDALISAVLERNVSGYPLDPLRLEVGTTLEIPHTADAVA